MDSEFRIVAPGARSREQAISAIRDSLKGSRENTLLFCGIHFAVPDGEFIFQVADASIHMCSESFVWKFWVISGSLDKTSPRKEVRYPAAMLCKRLTCLIICKVLRFPRAKCGADFVPIVHSRVKVSQHARFKVSKLSNLERQPC
jgi:hypothetical protein